VRLGYEAEAREVQRLFLDGKQREAAAAVPDRFIDQAAIVGPRERLAERVDAFREAGVTTLLCSTPQVEALRELAHIAL
jgi:alkanesulfonate monooxygenase SsuD/methylene tetrahydromethanopterin reductase-like flavin-dependent oxidoreductase (luciferase family)